MHAFGLTKLELRWIWNEFTVLQRFARYHIACGCAKLHFVSAAQTHVANKICCHSNKIWPSSDEVKLRQKHKLRETTCQLSKWYKHSVTWSVLCTWLSFSVLVTAVPSEHVALQNMSTSKKWCNPYIDSDISKTSIVRVVVSCKINYGPWLWVLS